MSFSSGDGWVHLTMALQNQSKLYIDISALKVVQDALSAYLGDARGIGLHECTESSEGRVLLLVVPDLVECLTPVQSEFWQERSNETRVHQSNPSYRNGGVLMQRSGSLRVQQNWDQA